MATKEKISKKEKKRNKRKKKEMASKPKKRISLNIGSNNGKKKESSIEETADIAYNRFIDRSFGLFFARTYEDRKFLVEPDESTKVIITGDENSNLFYYKPKVISKWKCEYFNSPHQMARLFLHQIMALIAAIFLGVISATVSTISMYAAIALMVVLYINFFVRYNNIALFGYAMPRLPYLSDLYVATIVNNIEINDDEDDDEEDEKDEELDKERENFKKRMARESEVVKVTPVEDINNGNLSPATILTRWMNNEAEWSISDLIDASGGLLDNFKVKQLLKNNDDAWLDPEILDTVSRITNSSASEWRNAYSAWENGD